MPENKTIDYLMSFPPMYLDNCEWKFYEGGGSLYQIPHAVQLKLIKPDDEKYPTVVLEIMVQNDEDGTFEDKVVLRLASYEFRELNEMFKRASFRLGSP